MVTTSYTGTPETGYDISLEINGVSLYIHSVETEEQLKSYIEALEDLQKQAKIRLNCAQPVL